MPAKSLRPFRFAVQQFSAPTAAGWTEFARRAEGNGYSALHLADHYFGSGPLEQSTRHPVQGLAAIPAMAHAAAVTSTIKIGCRVFCIDYHLPAVLAKEAATLDLLSDGRLELGLGAGWIRDEYDAMGIPFDRAGVRIDRLEEVIALMRAHFSGAQIDQRGEHVAVHSYSGVPLPMQRPGPPIMIRGVAKRVLGLAGREADIVSLNFNNASGQIGPGAITSTADATIEKLGWIRDGAGDRFDQLELEMSAYFTAVTTDRTATIEGLSGRVGLTFEQMRDNPHTLIGTIDEICDDLVARRERYGISYVTVSGDNADAFAPVVARLSGT